MYDVTALFLPFLSVIVFFPGISIFIYAWRLLVLYYCVNTEKKRKPELDMSSVKIEALMSVTSAVKFQ